MALNGTMVKIDTVTVGSGGASNIEFTNIPQTYTDLVVRISARTNGTSTYGDAILVQFNGATTNLSSRRLYGTGAGANSLSGTTAFAGQASSANQTANTFGNSELYIPNYTSSNNKSSTSDGVSENNAADAITQFSANLWSSTAAITSLKLLPEVGTQFVQYSTATLYGISRVAPGVKATGGMVYDTATHIYHLFASSGTFTPNQNIVDADFLVVAGGGGSFNYGSGAGGGGAGGLRTSFGSTSGGGAAVESKLSLNNGTAYTVTVGAGGAVQNHNSAGTPSSAASGSNSSLSGSGLTTITSNGGGGGGDYSAQTGATGGSGGGNGGNGTQTGGSGTANQGYRGGSGLEDFSVGGNAGGGGGAGGVGGNASNASGSDGGGIGGAGLAISITGTSVTYATGGKGGRNGGAVVNGTANTGNGGSRGASGGSGVVIIRYAK